MPLVSVDGKQLESPVIVDAVLLRKHEYQAPEVADQPRVDAVVALVRRHEDLRHRGDQALEAESLQVLQQDVLVDVEDLQT